MQNSSAKLTLMIVIVCLVLLSSQASALFIKSVSVKDMSPGESSSLNINVENNFDDDLEQVSMVLNFQETPFTPIGSSEDSFDNLDSDEDGTFVFNIRSSIDAKPGDYRIPYSITYKGITQPKTGVIGVRIIGEVSLKASINSENPILGSKDKISLKIVNDGFANARFVSVNLIPNGFTLLSDGDIYIGEINADDFETASFDVAYTSKFPSFVAKIEYLDFNNNKKVQNVILPLEIYTKDEAIKKGILTKSYSSYYVIAVILILLIWLIVRSIRKRIRLRKSRQNSFS